MLFTKKWLDIKAKKAYAWSKFRVKNGNYQTKMRAMRKSLREKPFVLHREEKRRK